MIFQIVIKINNLKLPLEKYIEKSFSIKQYKSNGEFNRFFSINNCVYKYLSAAIIFNLITNCQERPQIL